MLCYTPDFTGILSDARCAITGTKRRKRSANPYETVVDFFVGFDLDGHAAFNNLSSVPWLEQYGQLSIKPNPEISVFTEGDETRRLSSAAELVEIKGSNLLGG